MRHASLFSGIGGPEVAAAMLGWENVFHCEINPFGRAVLDYWFPESVSYEDITKTSFKEWRGRVDVLTGGFPCQPFSYAGKRGGRDDDRYLWPEMFRAIDEIRPTWVIGENVAGITTMVEGGVCADLGCDSSLFAEGDDLHRYELDRTFTIERICRDLEHLGYSVQPMLVPAAAVGAPHRRDRVFIIAFDAHADIGADDRHPGRDAEAQAEERECDPLAGTFRPCTSRTPSDSTGELRDGDCVGHGLQPRRGSMPEPGDGHREDDASHTDSTGREEPQSTGRGEDCPEGGEGVHDRTERSGRDGQLPTPSSRDWKGKTNPGVVKEGKRMQVRGDTPRYDCESLRPENRWPGFPAVSPVHRGNDGIPIRLDNLSIPFTKWRTESLKAYGNAIVPQVMYRIFQSIAKAEEYGRG